VWPALHELLLVQLHATGQLDLDRCAVDGSHIRAPKGGTRSARRRSRGRPGPEHHLIVDAGGVPLAVTLTGGNRHDVTQLIPLVEAVPPIRGRRPRPRRRPRELFADRGYDYDIDRHRPRAPRHHAADRPPRRRARLGSGQAALGRPTKLRLAARLQAAAHPV
jgi:hypothetical protein